MGFFHGYLTYLLLPFKAMNKSNISLKIKFCRLQNSKYSLILSRDMGFTIIIALNVGKHY